MLLPKRVTCASRQLHHFDMDRHNLMIFLTSISYRHFYQYYYVWYSYYSKPFYIQYDTVSQIPDFREFTWFSKISHIDQIFFSRNSSKILQSHDRGTGAYSNTVQWIKRVKQQVTDAKNTNWLKFKKTTITTSYTSLPKWLHTKYYTKGTVYSGVKAKAVTSGQEEDNNWAWITSLSCIRKSCSRKEFCSFVHGAVLILAQYYIH